MKPAASRLAIARSAAGFANARQAAQHFGWNYRTYFGHETGARGFAKSSTEYAQAFKVSEAWLLTGEGEGPTEGGSTLTPRLRSQSKRLAIARSAAKFRTAKAAAEHFGWSYSSYHNHEAGLRSFEKVADRYARAFGVSEAWLLTGEGNGPSDLLSQSSVVAMRQGERLVAARIAAGFNTARQAAQHFGWNVRTYSNHEAGERGIGRASNDYAHAFGVSEAWLLTGEGDGPDLMQGDDGVADIKQGKRLAIARTAAGFRSASEAAERFRWPKHTYVQHENGTRGITRAAKKYAQAFNVSEAWLLTGEGEGPTIAGANVTNGIKPRSGDEAQGARIIPAPQTPSDLVLVPIYNVEAAAGGGSLVEEENQIGVYPIFEDFIRSLSVNPKNLIIVEVRGDSMEPRFFSNDRIVVDTGDTNVSSAGFFLAFDGMGLVIKRISLLRNATPVKIRFSSTNSVYEPYEVPADQVRIIGRVRVNIGLV